MAVCRRSRVNGDSGGGEEVMRENNSIRTRHAETACGELHEGENEHEVIVIKDADDSSSSDSDAVGVSDLRFGRRAQPLRYSRATRYHMLLEVALERKRQRQESGASASKPITTNKDEAKGKGAKEEDRRQQTGNPCVLLYTKDPFASSSDESDGDWDPTAVYGEAARRRLKSRHSETESDSDESQEQESEKEEEESRASDSAGECHCDERIQGEETTGKQRKNRDNEEDVAGEQAANTRIETNGECESTGSEEGLEKQKAISQRKKRRNIDARRPRITDENGSPAEANSSSSNAAPARPLCSAPAKANNSSTSTSTCDSADRNSQKQKGSETENTKESIRGRQGGRHSLTGSRKGSG